MYLYFFYTFFTADFIAPPVWLGVFHGAGGEGWLIRGQERPDFIRLNGFMAPLSHDLYAKILVYLGKYLRRKMGKVRPRLSPQTRLFSINLIGVGFEKYIQTMSS